MKRSLCVTAVLFAAATAFAASAGAQISSVASENVHYTVGPANYNTPGGETLIVAGGQPVPTVGPGDHVVICHALGNGGFNQIAPSSGDVFGHAGSSHMDGADIIPPFKYVDNQGGENDTLQAGQNWDAAGQATYNNGCVPVPTKGTIKLVKSLSPSNDPGTFNLKIGDDIVASAVGNGGHSDAVEKEAGNYTVSEDAASSSYPLSLYTTTVSCTSDKSENVGHADSTSYQVTLHAGENIVCTFSNTRKPPQMGTLRVCKTLVDPTNSGDKFNLLVDGTTVKAAAGNGDCGDKEVVVGSHTASESAAGNANLDNYTVTYSESCPNGVAQVTYDNTTTCTITNTRKTVVTPPGTIKLCKALVPTTDNGKFNLLVGDGVLLANAGNGDCKSGQYAPGTYTVSETAGTGSNLSDYTSRVDCVSSLQEVDPDGTSTQVTLHSGETLICTFINARHQATPPGQCPEGTKQISDSPLTCEKDVTNTVTNTVTQTVTVYGSPSCPAGSTQTSSGPGYVVCNTTTTVTAPAGTCPAGFKTVPGSNPVQCTKTVTKVVVKKVVVHVKAKPKKKHVVHKPKKHRTVPAPKHQGYTK